MKLIKIGDHRSEVSAVENKNTNLIGQKCKHGHLDTAYMTYGTSGGYKLPRLHSMRRTVEVRLEGDKRSVVVQVPFIRNKICEGGARESADRNVNTKPSAMLLIYAL